ncbi:MAG: amidohydrolase family protein [Oscillospiraceae bacterium]
MKTLIQEVTAVLMDEEKTVLSNAYVAVEDGKITYVGDKRPAGTFREVIHGKGQVLMPGFVNCHTHIPMTLLRGYGGGCDLQTWLNDYIFPAEARLDDRAVAAGTDLGLAEMIASGVTCITDMYAHTGTIARRVMEAGISANLSCGGVYFGAAEDFSPDTCNDCKAQRALTEEWHGAGDGQIRVDASIHAEYTSNAPLWQWMADYARSHGLRMHVHVSETRSEHADSIKRNGKTPIQTLNQYGVWENGGVAAHCVYTTPEDWAIMKEKGISCAHNPYSNLKLGSGIAPIPAMRGAGVNVTLGTDGMSSHNSADLFADVKLAAILHNGANCDPQAVDPYEALKMATVNGGKALGRKTGKIETGYDADLILVNFDTPNNFPCHDVIENLVYASHGCDVTMNMARGKVIYKDGEYKTIDLERVKHEVTEYALPLIFGK